MLSPRKWAMPAQPSGPFTQKLEWRWFTGDPKWSRDFTESLFLPSPCGRSPHMRQFLCWGSFHAQHLSPPPLHTGPSGAHGHTVAPDPSQWIGPSVLSCAPASWPLALCSLPCLLLCPSWR